MMPVVSKLIIVGVSRPISLFIGGTQKVEKAVGKSESEGNAARELVLPRKLDEAIKVVKSAETGAIVVIPRELSGIISTTKVIQLMKAGLSATVEGGRLLLECVETGGKIIFQLREGESEPFKQSCAPYEAARGLVGAR